VFWYFVEILNNNNKSILLFLSMLILIIITYLFNNRVVFLLNIILYIIIVFYIYEYKYNLNFFRNIILLNYVANTNLINGVVLIHPILIYITYIILIVFIIFYKHNYNYIYKILINIRYNKYKLFLFSFTALFLGGWWAQQELNWGGWWNWDFVEIIALIFNILTLYIIHTNISKNYNLLPTVIKNIIFYLFFFFLFIRFDVLNSIHSFNSFSILNNFNKFVFILVYFIVFCIIFVIIFFFKKFKLNITSVNSVLFLFKFINTLFLIYIFINLFFILYLNFQFIDITKYIKYIILLSVYLILLLEFTTFNIIFISFVLLLCFLMVNFNFLNYIDILILMFIFSFNKTYLNTKKRNLLSHYLFIIFLLHIKYNNIHIYMYVNNINFNNFFIKTDTIESLEQILFFNNKNSLFFNTLINYYYNTNFNQFYSNSIIYINNIIVNNNIYCYYNLDNFLKLFFYKFNFIFYNILIMFLI